MREAVRSIVALAVLTALAGAAIAWFAAFTQGDIDDNRIAAETQVLRELAGFAVQPNAGDVLRCDAGLLVLRGRGRGYGGSFKIAVALRTDPTVAAGATSAGVVVQAVRVLEHAETPGFADILAADSPWLASFRFGAADAVTGATITSTAVLRAVADTLARYQREGLCR